MAKKPELRGAQKWCAAYHAAGCEVRNVQLPYPIAETHGKDLTDWLLEGHTYHDLLALYDETPVWAPPGEEAPTGSGPSPAVSGTASSTPDGLEVNEADDDPHRLARLFLERYCSTASELTLRYWQGEWYRWNGHAYRKVPEGEIRAELTTSIKQEFDRLNLAAMDSRRHSDGTPEAIKVTKTLVNSTLQAMAGQCLLSGTSEPPCWIEGTGKPDAGEILATRDALVHLPSLVAGASHRGRPSPNFFSFCSLDYGFTLDAPEPVEWLKFLRVIWPDDPQSIDTLQQWMGYLLLPDTRQQKIMMLVGPTRCGKGTIARVIRRLVGEANVAAPTFSSLGTNFGLWPLLGKTVAIVSDARLSSFTDTAAVVERLLSISGEDAITVDRKNLPPLTTHLTARFMVLTNEIPMLGDASGAIANRMVTLQFTRSFLGREDTSLTDKLISEMPGILLWAIRGWEKLRQKGRFTQPETGRQILDVMQELSSPISKFISDRCIVGPEYEVERYELFESWKSWCEAEGMKAGKTEIFGRNLRAAVPGIRDTQPWVTIAGVKRKVRFYKGISLTAAEQARLLLEQVAEQDAEQV